MRANKSLMNGPIVKAKALEIAVSMGIIDFKASDGWYTGFKNRHLRSVHTVVSDSELANLIKEEPVLKKEAENPLAGVFIKAEDSFSNDTCSEIGVSNPFDFPFATDNDMESKPSIEDKLTSLHNLSSDIQNQIDLLQKNVDIKLNYLECLLKTILRNQKTDNKSSNFA